MSIQIQGFVKELESGRGVAGATVEVYRGDALYEDMLGSARSDDEGAFRVVSGDSQEAIAAHGLCLVAKDNQNRVLKLVRAEPPLAVSEPIAADIPIAHGRLSDRGLAPPEEVVRTRDAPSPAAIPPLPKMFTELTLAEPQAPDRDLFGAVLDDLRGKATILELLKSYMEQVKESPDNLSVPFRKMELLFRLGLTQEQMNGHYYGIALGLRMTGEAGPLSQVNNAVGLLWGHTLEDESPWVGKSFMRMADHQLQSYGPPAGAKTPGFLGINHFNRLEYRPLNSISFHVLKAWLNLSPATEEEKNTFGYEQKGGFFVSYRAPSVWEHSPREVFQLNYRIESLNNRPPLAWLIDEMVQIADGLYLGQLLFATKHLMADYDPAQPPSESHYRHMGYFALFDARWNAEGRRLFPFLEIPITAPGMVTPTASITPAGRYGTLKCETPAPPICNDQIFAQVQADLRAHKTVMHLLKHYSDVLQDKPDNNSPYFLRLQEMFNRGAVVKDMNGFYRGALITWHSEGLFNLCGTNLLNVVWRSFAGRLSTWMGKSFEPIPTDRLREFTDGHETGALPTYWGANTQALRTMKEREVGRLMELAGIWSDPVAGAEALQNGYDLKNFFFIARAADSVNENCMGKRIFQFNYRWPKLRTIPPDCWCLDEMVEIAEGLFLGQLMYATNITKPYDPTVPPSEYRYGNFGYFLLMEEDWHKLRLQIGFDLENT